MKAHHTFNFSFIQNHIWVSGGAYGDIILAKITPEGSEWLMEYWVSETESKERHHDTLEDAIRWLNNNPSPLFEEEAL